MMCVHLELPLTQRGEDEEEDDDDGAVKEGEGGDFL